MGAVGGRAFDFGVCLGRGGFGEVYRARMSQPDGVEHTVAVKLLLDQANANDDAVRRLKDEARLLARLEHPAILTVHALALLDGRLAMVCELIDGQDLAEAMAGPDPIPLRGVLEVISEIAAALDLAWTAPLPEGGTLGLVHRDVKPSNIRLSRQGDVRLLDFGIARTDAVTREAKTVTNGILGSPPYMAPERYFEDDLLPASDAFSLGACLFEAIVGERWYGRRDVMRIAGLCAKKDKYCEWAAGRLRDLPDTLDPSIRELLTDLMAFDADVRPVGAALVARLATITEQLEGRSLSRWASERDWPAPKVSKGPLTGRRLVEGPATEADTETLQTIWVRDGRFDALVSDAPRPSQSALEGHGLAPPALTGSTSPERAGSRRLSLGLGLAALGVLVSCAGLGGLGALGWVGLGEPSAVEELPVEADAPETVPADADPEPPREEPLPVEEPAAPPAPAPLPEQTVTPPAPRPDPEPARPEPVAPSEPTPIEEGTPEPEPEPAEEAPVAATATIVVAQDSAPFQVLVDGVAVEAGAVPTGRVVIRATFPGGRTADALEWDLQPGERWSVYCSPRLYSCKKTGA